MRRIACATLLLAATAALSAREAEAKYCPRVLYRATRLVLARNTESRNFCAKGSQVCRDVAGAAEAFALLHKIDDGNRRFR